MKRRQTNFLIDRFENNTKLQLIFIILLPLIVYLKVITINYQFISFDDYAMIQSNIDFLSDIKNIPKAFVSDIALNKTGNSFYRPLQTVTFMIDASISGLNPWMFHLSNLLLHLVTTIALYFFLRQLKLKNITSFFFTLLFSIHPLLASAVAWTPARGDLLIGVLGLLLFITFYNYFEKKKSLYLILHAIIFFLAVFSKETAVLFPLLLVFYYFFVFKREKFNFKILLPFFAVWICVLILFYILRSTVITGKLSNQILGFAPFIKNLPALPVMFGKYFIPIGLTTLGFFDITSIIIGIVSFITIVFLFIKYPVKNKYPVLMGFGWFLLFTIPPMFYRLKLAEYFYTYLEHRAYLPTIGLIILSAFFINDLITPNTVKKIFYIFSLIIILFGVLSSIHTNDYENSYVFFGSAISHNPNNAGAYTSKGIAFYNANETDSALAYFNKAIEICGWPIAYYNRGLINTIRKNQSAAEEDYTNALAKQPEFYDALVNRAYERGLRSDYTNAVQDLDKAIELDSNNAIIYYNHGNMLLYLKKYNEAIKSFTKAVTLNPGYYEAYNNRGIAEFNIRDYKGTIEDCKIVIQIKPDFVHAYSNIGLAYNELGMYDDALPYFNKAISLDVNYSHAYYGRGIVEQKRNDLEDARKDWEEALRLGYAPAKEMLDKYKK